MFFHNVVIPMRAQPFHKGHAHLIQTMARYSKNVAVALYNHHEDCYGIWHMHPMPAGLRVANNGRIIRERLRNGLECDAYLHRDVAFLARMII